MTYKKPLVLNSNGTTEQLQVDNRLQATDIGLVNQLGTPTISVDVENAISFLSSGGVVDGGDITDNGDGSIDLAECTVQLKSAPNDALATTVTSSVPEATGLVLDDGVTTYVTVNYNSGNPVYDTTLDQSSINGQDVCLAYFIHRDDTKLYIVDDRQHSLDTSRKTRDVFRSFGKFIHSSDGSKLSEAGSLGLAVTNGKFYYGVQPLTHEAFDTSLDGTTNDKVFSLCYSDGSDGFTIEDETKSIDSTVYDDGSGTLASLDDDTFGVTWVYIVNSTDSHLYTVVGQEEYANQSEAERASLPVSIPSLLQSHGSLIGYVVYEKGATSFANVLSAFTQTFSSSAPNNHNGLSGLQGGAVDDYQHLSTEQVADLTRLKDTAIDRKEPTGFVRENPDYMGVLEFCVDGTKIISVDNNGTKSVRTDGKFATDTAFEQDANALEMVIYPTTSFYRVYVNSVKYDITTLQKITFSSEAQLQFAYHDENGILQTDADQTEEYFLSSPITATLYYNPDADEGLRDINFGDERHGTAFTGLEHYIAHFTEGTKYISGMSVEGLTADGLTFDQVTAGEAADEDILIKPDAQSTMPTIYLDGTTWFKSTDDNNVGLLSADIAQYNPNTNGDFSLVDVADSDMMIVFFVFTNNIEYPYVKILSQTTYADANKARAALDSAWRDISLSSLPSPEFLPIGAMIVDKEGKLQDLSDGSLYSDLRKSRLGSVVTSSGATSHKDLLDRDSIDSHPMTAVSGLVEEMTRISDEAEMFSATFS